MEVFLEVMAVAASLARFIVGTLLLFSGTIGNIRKGVVGREELLYIGVGFLLLASV